MRRIEAHRLQRVIEAVREEARALFGKDTYDEAVLEAARLLLKTQGLSVGVRGKVFERGSLCGTDVFALQLGKAVVDAHGQAGWGNIGHRLSGEALHTSTWWFCNYPDPGADEAFQDALSDLNVQQQLVALWKQLYTHRVQEALERKTPRASVPRSRRSL